jgi:SAM-dependent methyltransferase
MAPAAWVTGHAHLLPRQGLALDVASGRGRHAFWLASHGCSVVALDRDPEAVDYLQREAAARHLPIVGAIRDLESGSPSIGADLFHTIIVVHYLHRPLFPSLIAALRPGGLLMYETFTRKQAARGKPTNPDFLLMEGELRRLVEPLEILDWREGEFDGKDVASVVARKAWAEKTEETVFTNGGTEKRRRTV